MLLIGPDRVWGPLFPVRLEAGTESDIVSDSGISQSSLAQISVHLSLVAIGL